jgi:hypothetical protein
MSGCFRTELSKCTLYAPVGLSHSKIISGIIAPQILCRKTVATTFLAYTINQTDMYYRESISLYIRFAKASKPPQHDPNSTSGGKCGTAGLCVFGFSCSLTDRQYSQATKTTIVRGMVAAKRTHHLRETCRPLSS